MKKTTLFEKAFVKRLEEKLNPKKHDAGDYVKDFQKSKAPQFKGKSKKKKREMAIAAYLDAKEEDENTVGGGALGSAAAAGLGNTVSGTPGTDAYATGDFSRPVALGAVQTRRGAIKPKRKKRRKRKKS